jgi:hypothetical protein
MELHRRQEALGVLGVVGEDVRAELHLAAGLADPLAHFERHRVRELVGLRMHDRRGLGHDDRALGIGLVPPGLEAGRGGARSWSRAPCPSALELLQELAVGGIEALVGHGFLSSMLSLRMASSPWPLGLDDHLERLRLGGVAEGLVGIEDLVELEAMRDQQLGIDLVGARRS